MLFAIGILYFIGALGSAFVTDLALFQIFRFLGGIGVGVASVVAPVYTAEFAPPALRGRLVGLVQFNIVLGILLAYLSNFVIGSLLPAEVAWRCSRGCSSRTRGSSPASPASSCWAGSWCSSPHTPSGRAR